MKWNESGSRPLLCTYGLNWTRRTSWGWWGEWEDFALQTQDSKFKPWRSEGKHATSRSRRLPSILSFTSGWRRNIFVSFKPPRSGNEHRALAWKAVVLTTTLGPPPTPPRDYNTLLIINSMNIQEAYHRLGYEICRCTLSYSIYHFSKGYARLFPPTMMCCYHGYVYFLVGLAWRSVWTTLSMDSLIVMLCVLSCRLMMKICMDHAINGFTHRDVMCIVLQAYDEDLYGPCYQCIHSSRCYVYCLAGLWWRCVWTTLSMDSLILLLCVLSCRIIMKVCTGRAINDFITMMCCYVACRLILKVCTCCAINGFTHRVVMCIVL